MRREDLLREEITQIDMSAIGTPGELVEAMGKASFQARALADAAKIWEAMLRDDVHVFVGMSGAMIAGGLRKVVVDLVRANFIDAVVSTGAILYQDLYQATGHRHFKGAVDSPDAELHDLFIDRIYDTYVDEEAFRELDVAIGHRFAGIAGVMGTRDFLRRLADMAEEPGSILRAAADKDLPIFCPAIADSSIGIGLAVVRSGAGKGPVIDTTMDTVEMAKLVANAPATGAVYLGGGVPKNYINDAVVAADMMHPPVDGHRYAIQVTMDRPEWGGLSGSTLKEAQSWGKVGAKATKAMVYVEMTVALPLIAGYLLEA
ncbi:MAG: deoxyhypusine synthase family protein, partial [Thermoplasmata archaeon]|nr:deoxyhypusine synthase family protein [Thermoplasmata archaeon]